MKYSIIIFFTTCLLMNGKLHGYEIEPYSSDTVTVEIKGTNSNPRFIPAIVKINPDDVIRFVNHEGLHTVTAYHPDNRRPQRIPDSAESFDSGPLKPGDIWDLKINDAGIYDYYCLPHEQMGHTGRIISGSDITIPDYPEGHIPKAVLKTIEQETTTFYNNQQYQ